jgi:hypothetical protein
MQIIRHLFRQIIRGWTMCSSSKKSKVVSNLNYGQ